MQKLEDRRITEQVRLDSLKSSTERNKLGQFATPPALALEIVRHAILIHGANRKIRFFDPAIGTGSFYSALLSSCDRSNIETAAGVEIDAAFANAATELWRPAELQVTNADFTCIERPTEKFNLVITNPPYVRHHHLSTEDKIRLKNMATRFLGRNVSGLSGLYCYFMLLCHAWLESNALSVWLIPSEFMDVNYGVALKHYLTERVTLLQIHRYDPAELQFDDALVSSAIVIFRNQPPEPRHKARFSYGGSLTDPRSQSDIDMHSLIKIRKWSGLPQTNNSISVPGDYVPLSDLFTIRRGIATGSNEFFVMPLSKAEKMGFVRDFLKPILPPPRQLSQKIIESRSDGYAALEEPLALIDTDRTEEYIAERCPELLHYLKQGEASGLKETYLISKRRPWYRQEQREPCPFFCTYMGRSIKNKPFKFIWNRSQAISANTYLMLYPIGALKSALLKDSDLYERTFDFLDSIAMSDLIGEGRVYGGGLHKVEPAELGRVNAKKLADQLQLEPTSASPVQLSLLDTCAV